METKELIGVTLADISISQDKDRMLLTSVDGRVFEYLHEQDCCESVEINEVHGDLSDLIGTPILFAEETSNENDVDNKPSEYSESWTWTFYRFHTIKGSVTVRWLGESNGYYSEDVSLREITDGEAC